MFWTLINRALARRHPLKSYDQVKAEVDARRDALGHELAQRYSRGNVNIKMGQFTTRSDLDQRKDLRSAD